MTYKEIMKHAENGYLFYDKKSQQVGRFRNYDVRGAHLYDTGWFDPGFDWPVLFYSRNVRVATKEEVEYAILTQ